MREARRADGVVNAASSDHRGAVDALVEALKGSGKPFLRTSGSSIIGDQARGEASDVVFHDEPPTNPEPDKVARVAFDRSVLNATGVRSVVLCNIMLYGLGAEKQSDQVPLLPRYRTNDAGGGRHRALGL